MGDFPRRVIVTDERVEPLYAERLARALSGPEIQTDLFVVPAGESTKSVEMAQVLWNGLLASGADRRTVLIALGGGVVGDLTGFVAATYARGIPYFQIPTTLLAQVDSSVGGKTGIDLPDGKNMVGAFHQPIGVLIDPELLQTLSERDFRAGLGETVKYAVSLDAKLFEFLENNAAAVGRRSGTVLAEIVAQCCRIKAAVVRADEKESIGVRTLLNYGHTFAHAYETAGKYSLLFHGEAVSIGMLDAVRLARILGQKGRKQFAPIDTAMVRRHEKLFRSLALPTALEAFVPVGRGKKPWDIDALVELMKRDKKAQNGLIRLVLPTSLGRCGLFDDVPENLLRRTIRLPKAL